jgi:hypothetical protein
MKRELHNNIGHHDSDRVLHLPRDRFYVKNKNTVENAVENRNIVENENAVENKNDSAGEVENAVDTEVVSELPANIEQSRARRSRQPPDLLTYYGPG